MKAFVLDRYGKKETLRAAEVPEPALREDDVLTARCPIVQDLDAAAARDAARARARHGANQHIEPATRRERNLPAVGRP